MRPTALAFASLSVSNSPASEPEPGSQRGEEGEAPPEATAQGPQPHSEVEVLRQQLREKQREADKLAGTLAHYRSWASQLQSRYQSYHPEAVRPARRIYVGGLPPANRSLDSACSSQDSTGTTLSCTGTTLSGPIASLGASPALASPLSSLDTPKPDSSQELSLGPESRKSLSRGICADRTAAYATQLEADLRHFINSVFTNAGACAAPGFPVTSCKVYPDKWYAFCEFRSVEEATNCMALDGISFRGSVLRVRRPNNYDIDVAIMLGITEPDPSNDIMGQGLVRTVVPDTPHKLFLGGLPCDWTEEQVKALLLPFGPLRAFNLVQDKVTGNSKGYAFCEYLDVGCTDAAIHALNAKQVGKRFLTAKRAVAPQSHPRPLPK